MKYKGIYFLIIITFLGYSIYETILYSKIKDTFNEYRIFIKKQNFKDSVKLTEVKSHLNINYNFSGFDTFANNLILEYDIEGKLIVFFRHAHCGSCVLSLLAEVDSLIISESVGFDDIVLIGQYEVENPFTYKVMEKYSKQFRNIWINSEHYYKPLADWPFLFIAEKNKSHNYLYIPDLIPMFKKTYFNEIIPKKMINKDLI
jgi:hypothetical protein